MIALMLTREIQFPFLILPAERDEISIEASGIVGDLTGGRGSRRSTRLDFSCHIWTGRTARKLSTCVAGKKDMASRKKTSLISLCPSQSVV